MLLDQYAPGSLPKCLDSSDDHWSHMVARSVSRVTAFWRIQLTRPVPRPLSLIQQIQQRYTCSRYSDTAIQRIQYTAHYTPPQFGARNLKNLSDSVRPTAVTKGACECAHACAAGAWLLPAPRKPLCFTVTTAKHGVCETLAAWAAYHLRRVGVQRGTVAVGAAAE